MTLNIVHLDDDLTTLDRFTQLLNSKNFSNQSIVNLKNFDKVSDFKSAILSKSPIDVSLIDMDLNDTETGVDLARFTRKEAPNAVILIVSSTKDTKTIRDCLRAGADDFVSKKAETTEIITRIEAALEERKALKEKHHLDDKEFAGETIQSIKARVPSIMNSAINCIYIDGESGTGKEVVANLFAEKAAIKSPFIRVNCGAISSGLLMSELFGHTKGSFTGAATDKTGLLEAANGGWIFLDEVATLPSEAQIALLRTIDNQTVRRVGSNTEIPIQFRVLSATNEPLEELVRQGKFRMDLWQRLRETHISLPPLRLRKKEIPDLVNKFLTHMRGGPYQLAPTVLETLIAYDWAEGNIRELRNVLRAMTEKSIQGLLTPKSIPERIWSSLDFKKQTLRRSTDTNNAAQNSQISITWQGSRPNLDILEKKLFLETLKQEYLVSGALSLRSIGSALGIAKSTISTKLRALVDDKVVSQEELNKLLKNGFGKTED